MTVMTVSLLCDSCCVPFAADNDQMVCPKCGKRVSSAGGIVDLVSGSAATALDDIDYDAMYAISAERSREQFCEIRETLGAHLPATARRVLEIGAGTGGFTIGFLDNVEVENAVISDISAKMLAVCKHRIETCRPGQAVQYVTHSGVENCFANDTFDLVVGSFVLHHVLDFDETLCQIHDWLAPGGSAIFLEPNGTAMRAMVMAFCEVIHHFTDEPAYADDLSRLTSWVEGLNHGLVYSGVREVLAHQEDKHFFSRPQLEQAAQAAGFGQIELLPYGLPDCGANAAWVYLGQLNLSEHGRAAFFRCFRTISPRIYALVGDRDGAASYAIALKKTGTKSTPAATAPVKAFDYAVDHSCGHVTVSVETTADGAELNVSGWVTGLDQVKYLEVDLDGQVHTTTVGRGRIDVMRALEARYPLQNALYSGVGMHQALPGGEPAAGTAITLRLRFAAGGERTLPPAALDAEKRCEFIFG